MVATPTIYDASIKCISELEECLEVEALMQDEWAERRLGDLNLWVSGSGAHAKGKASLDARLVTKPEALQIIYNLLLLLSLAIESCKSSATTPLIQLEPAKEEGVRDPLVDEESDSDEFENPFNASDDSDGDDDDYNESSLGDGSVIAETPLQLHMNQIETTLRQLSEISVAIRKSGRRSRLQKADQLFQPSMYSELRTHIKTALLMYSRTWSSSETFQALLNKWEPLNQLGQMWSAEIQAADLSEIQERLIHCNLRRRHRFAYQQRHSKKLESARRPQTTALQPSKAQEAKVSAADLQESETILDPGIVAAERASDRISNESAAKSRITAMTGTSASGLSESFVMPHIQLHRLPAASTIMSSTVVDIKYPRPPTVKSGAINFKCPCCCQTLPIVTRQKNKWKKHVADDLMPYTCVLPHCDKPDLMYGTKELWQKHMLNDHYSYVYWRCLSCKDGTQFRDETSFTTHLLQRHSDTVPSDKVNSLKLAWKMSAPAKVSCCPICYWPQGEDGEVDQGALLDHIAKEVHRFSLLSLPWADHDDTEPVERLRHSFLKVSVWLEKYELSKNSDETPPTIQPKSIVPGYFRGNAYFGDSSASSSSDDDDGSARSLQQELEYLREQQKYDELIDAADPDKTQIAVVTSDDASEDEEDMDKDAFTEAHRRREVASLNIQDAAYVGEGDRVRDLLNSGVEADTTDHSGETALQNASARGHRNIAKLLLLRRANIDATSETYGTALQAAASGGHEIVVETLLRAGADVNIQGGYYGNALQAAAAGGHERIVVRLLEAGAFVNASGGFYKSALQAASSRGMEKVVDVLKAHGANDSFLSEWR